jgi:hypothetical protein
MECSKIEPLLSDYMEACLPDEDAGRVEKHLQTCPNCAAVLHEMQSVLSLCKNYPSLELDPQSIEKILLQTSGRPRTRSFKEILRQYIVRPLLTPKLAVGATLATLFLIFMLDLMLPKLSVSVSSLSPTGLIKLMDRGAQQLYGEGLKAYNKKNEWQAQFNRFKNNTLNSLQSIMDQMEVPVEGHKKPEEPAPKKNRAPKEKSSSLIQWPA